MEGQGHRLATDHSRQREIVDVGVDMHDVRGPEDRVMLDSECADAVNGIETEAPRELAKEGLHTPRPPEHVCVR